MAEDGEGEGGFFGFGLCAQGSQDSTANSTLLSRPTLVTKKVLKPKQLMMNTSVSTLPTVQQATTFKYMIQTQGAAYEDEDLNQFENDVYEKDHLAFELKHDLSKISYFGFAQRRFIGFRNRYEFEKKRLFVANQHGYSIVGYDHRMHVYELMRHEVDDPEN